MVNSGELSWDGQADFYRARVSLPLCFALTVMHDLY